MGKKTNDGNKKKLSSGAIALIIVLAVVVLGFAWYFLFFSPLKEKTAEIENKAIEVQEEIEALERTAQKADYMREYLADSYNTASRIETYSNMKAELKFLNAMLNEYLKVKSDDNYSISFEDPYVDKNTIEYDNVTAPAVNDDEFGGDAGQETAGEADESFENAGQEPDGTQASLADASGTAAGNIYAAAVRRPLAISFSASNFKKADKILTAIEKSEYRALFTDISVSDDSKKEILLSTAFVKKINKTLKAKYDEAKLALKLGTDAEKLMQKYEISREEILKELEKLVKGKYKNYKALLKKLESNIKEQMEAGRITASSSAQDTKKTDKYTLTKVTGLNDNKDRVSVTIKMEFIETLHGCTDTSGVEVPVNTGAESDSAEGETTESDYASDILAGLAG